MKNVLKPLVKRFLIPLGLATARKKSLIGKQY